MSLRCRARTPLACRRATVETGHVGLGAGFIEKNEVIEVGEASRDAKVQTPAGYVRAVLLVGSKRLFLKITRSSLRRGTRPSSCNTSHLALHPTNKHSSVASESFATIVELFQPGGSVTQRRPPAGRGPMRLFTTTLFQSRTHGSFTSNTRSFSRRTTRVAHRQNALPQIHRGCSHLKPPC
jgi:hypothetical protein